MEDERRELDPVKSDVDAIKYWHKDDVMSETVQYFARTRGLSLGVVASMLTTRFRIDGRYGAGAKAIAEKRQIYLDASEIGKNPMINLTRRIVDEAIDQRVGIYHPLSEELFRAA